MKKIMIAAIVVALIALFYFASRTGVDKPTKVIVGDKDREASELVLRFGHNIPEDSAMHQAALRFAKSIDEKSGGKIKIVVYPAQQLGNDHQMVEMARAGELDILLQKLREIDLVGATPIPIDFHANRRALRC